MNIKIDPEFHSLIRPLGKSEYSQLEQSIVAEGCRDPLVVWKGLLLDGHSRYEICQKHGVKFKTKENTNLRDREEAKCWIIYNQMARRNLTNYQKCVLALKLEPFIAEEAERRKRDKFSFCIPRTLTASRISFLSMSFGLPFSTDFSAEEKAM